MKRKITAVMAMAFILTAAGCTQSPEGSVSSQAQESSTIAAVSQQNSDGTTSTVQESAKASEQESVSSEAEASVSSDTSSVTSQQTSADAVSAAYSPSTDGKIETTDLFSNRDLLQTPELSSAKTLQVSDNDTLSITEEGIYLITGTAANCTIRVEAPTDAKVQLVLDSVAITNESTPAIYVVSADKCFVTTSDGTSSLSVTDSFTADGETNTDAVIFSKEDLVLNGTGTLEITSSQGNGISGKDDVKITGGTYVIRSAEDGIEANDSVSICGGSFEINTSKDAINCGNDEDTTKGQVYIYDGTFRINAADDGIQSMTVLQIDGGTFDITASEGLEGTYIQINDGTISINASDDGINAAQKSSYSTPTVEINGGSLTIVMGQGDTDAIDANGNIYVNGGTIDITATVSSFDYDGTAEYNGGTIIINGQQVNSIPQSMMGGMGGMGGMQGGMGGMPGGMQRGMGDRAF